jgi:5-formyltetrahydrofolate cyclo-ligase
MTDQPVDSAAFRRALRGEKIAARQALPAAAHQQASHCILEHLATLLATRPPGRIAFCWPVRAEVDCRPLITRLGTAGWQAAMPVVVAPATPMQFRHWTPATPMTLDPHGIPVPDTAPCAPPDVLLLPLVAFDTAGFRLGYGGGYFDRTLATCMPRPFTVGVGFACAGVATIHPEPHDIPLDAIVTENGVLCRSAPVAGPP